MNLPKSEDNDRLIEYVQQAADLMGLNLTSEYLPGVVANFTTLTKISSLVTEFDLAEDLEVAPIFEP